MSLWGRVKEGDNVNGGTRITQGRMKQFNPNLLAQVQYLSFLVPIKNEFVTTISPAVHLKLCMRFCIESAKWARCAELS